MIMYILCMHRGNELDNWYRIAALHKVNELKKDINLKNEKIKRLLGIITKFEDSESI